MQIPTEKMEQCPLKNTGMVTKLVIPFLNNLDGNKYVVLKLRKIGSCKKVIV